MDKQIPVDRQQEEPKSSQNEAKPFTLMYWRANIEKTERLLPLAVGNLTVSSTNQVNMVLRFGSDNHNIYDNIAGQLLTAKLNIKNEVKSCRIVNEAIEKGDKMLYSLNYHGIGTVAKELPISVMKNMIKVHTSLSQFNTHGCSGTS